MALNRAVILGPVALLLYTGPGHAADDMRVLSPVSDWTLDFADERCSLIREFASGEDRMRLQIDSYGPSLGYRAMLSGDLVAGSDAAPIREFRVGYSPDTGERPTMIMFKGKFGDDNAVSFGPAFLPDRPFAEWVPSQPQPASDWPGSDFQRSVRHVTVSFGDARPFQLDTGTMAAPFAAMHQCSDDLMTSWGIDPVAHRGRSQPPKLVDLPKGYARVRVDLENDRPGYTERRYQAIARAQASHRAGPRPSAGFVLPVRIMIDATGQVTACVAQVATADESARRSICEQFGGPYQPALDGKGQPMASFIQLGTDEEVQVAAN